MSSNKLFTVIYMTNIVLKVNTTYISDETGAWDLFYQ